MELLNHKVSPQSIWDALFVGAGELLMRQPGIVGLHAVTSTNALHFAYQASTDEPNRRLLLLQNAAFLPMFRGAMEGRGKVADIKLAELKPADLTAGGAMAVDQILSDVSKEPSRQFVVPSAMESMRIMFHSCNGFSVGTDEDFWSGQWACR